MLLANTKSERNIFHSVIKISAMKTLGARIAHYRNLAGMSQAALAKACKWGSQSRVGNYERDTREPSLDDIARMASVLRVPIECLLLGDPGAQLDQAEHSNVAPALQPRRAPRAYPLISWVAAGERAESPDNYYPGDGEEMLESTENAGEHGYWLRVKGRSMTSETPPSFPPGTPILVRPEGFDVISGKFYIAKHRDGETTFKQYVRDAGTAYLVPLNPAFNQVEMDDEWRLIGRVVDAKITGL